MTETDAVHGLRIDLSDRLVVVTGAAHGQGRAEAELAVACGARVLALDVMPADQVGLPTPGLEYVEMDVSDASAWERLGDLIDRDHGGAVHGLINNAAVTNRESLLTTPPQLMQDVYAVNLIGPMLGIQALAPRMGRNGSIINIGSVAAHMGYFAAPYATSKWALRGLTRTAALELGDRGIRVNAIHPGFIQTEMSATLPQVFVDVLQSQSPLARLGAPIDVANVALFLLSDLASFVTGVDIAVDGGLLSHRGGKPLRDAFLSVSGR
ncbi:3alpha(or 20beta)-hydroxysteroid dehydrogenase [Micromonospora inositola]|uniref:3alpha(Or 20beta)-hydroxysteroid dehydrogenase n=1 Tax=Micromonospora inositola TaxID=47865 RepID=A0A1C5JMX7_9ACTN|nr:3alpha(or 20beta)-hydroxysteroid dehydrogenase [Micromonospora inositola]